MKQRFAIEQLTTSPGGPVGTYIADGANLDAFSRLRVSNSQTLFEVLCAYNTEALRMEFGLTGDGVAPAHSANTRMVALTINAGAAGGTSWMQSFEYVPYQPGKSQFAAITGVLGTGVDGVLKEYGYGDQANGIFYQQNGTGGIRFNRRTSTSGGVANNTVDQASWNIDPLNGTGPSGLTIDTTKSFILIIDLQFLGMGRVRVGFDINGVVYYAHQFLNANSLTVPYMQTASLPISCLISAAAGLAAPATMHFKCAQVASEGGYDPASGGRDFTVEGAVSVSSGARTHIISIRPKTTFNGITNRGFFDIHDIQVLAGLNAIYVEVCIGVVFTAPLVFADVNGTYSFMEYNTAGTYSSLVGGVVIASTYVGTGAGGGRVSGGGNVAISYPISLDRAGAQRALGTLSILATGISGASASRGAFNWHEVR